MTKREILPIPKYFGDVEITTINVIMLDGSEGGCGTHRLVPAQIEEKDKPRRVLKCSATTPKATTSESL